MYGMFFGTVYMKCFIMTTPARNACLLQKIIWRSKFNALIEQAVICKYGLSQVNNDVY